MRAWALRILSPGLSLGERGRGRPALGIGVILLLAGAGTVMGQQVGLTPTVPDSHPTVAAFEKPILDEVNRPRAKAPAYKRAEMLFLDDFNDGSVAGWTFLEGNRGFWELPVEKRADVGSGQPTPHRFNDETWVGPHSLLRNVLPNGTSNAPTRIERDPKTGLSGTLRELRVGIAGHAFDHLGRIGEQAAAAAASGSTIIYATGFGGDGYMGLPGSAELEARRKAVAAYLRQAKAGGIRLALGYVCATSIVKLETFDRNWPAELRSQLTTPPAQWLQCDVNGQPLPSWYGGDYRPACMNNRDWRRYEEFIVRLQIESGHDGIFFDNPTVHPQGCYCEHCMGKFKEFLLREGQRVEAPATNSLAFLRQLAQRQAEAFLRFRCTTARDFLGQMRACARRVTSGALVACNNSLNAPEAFYSQCRGYGYNIHEMSQAEDLVVIEDMGTQPRMLADGRVVEYGPAYALVGAIAHGRPVVAVTIAEGDYHTPPNLVRLAMAEAVAREASYLLWPTWPEKERARMCGAIRPQAELLRKHAPLLNDTRPRADVLLFLPFRRWVETGDCQALRAAQALSRANVQFDVVSEDHLRERVGKAGRAVLLVESTAVLMEAEREAVRGFESRGGRVLTTEKESWLGELRQRLDRPAVVVQGPTWVRAVVRDQGRKTIVHLFNLNVQRRSSFEDEVTPVTDLDLQVRVPFKKVRKVRLLTADEPQPPATVCFSASRDGEDTLVSFTLSRLAVSTIAVIE